MARQKLDNETQEEIKRSERLNSLVRSRGWSEAKGMLLQKLAALDSITKFVHDGKSPEEMMSEFKAQVSAIAIIQEWLADIEGTSEQHEQFMESLEEKKIEGDYIIRRD